MQLDLLDVHRLEFLHILFANRVLLKQWKCTNMFILRYSDIDKIADYVNFFYKTLNALEHSYALLVQSVYKNDSSGIKFYGVLCQ